MKKSVSLLLALSLVMALLAPMTALAEPITISVCVQSTTTIPEDDPILPMLEKALDVDFDWNTVTSEYDTQLNVRLVGGNAPDVFAVNRTLIGDYGAQDLLLDIEPYLDRMPNLVNAYSEQDINRGRYNGKLYSIAMRPYMAYVNNSIRQDWLTALNLETPKTLDDLFNVMYAFTYKDPDGNGLQDTYGLTGVGVNAFEIVFIAFGVAKPNNFMIVDNQVQYSSTMPVMADAIRFIQKCIEAGVVDPELISNTTTTARDKCISGKVGIFAGISFWDILKATFMEQVHAVNPNAEWKPLLGVVGNSDVVYDVMYDSSSSSAYYAINADLQNQPEKLEKVLALFDYLCDEDGGQRLVMFGLEGVHYQINEEGNVVALDAMQKLTHTYNFQLTGRDDLPYLLAKFSYLEDAIYTSVNMNKLSVYNAVVTPPETVTVSDTERYAMEEIAKFIYGERSLDTWNEYVDTMNKSFHLTEYLAKAHEDLKLAGYIAD